VAAPTLAVLGALDAALCYATGLLVLFAAPGRPTNRVLAALLAFEGTAMLGAGTGAPTWGSDPGWRAGMAGLFAVSMGALPALYLLVLRELDTPLVRPLRARLMTPLLLAAALGGAWINLLHSPYPDGETAVNQRTYFLLGLTNVLGLVAALHAWSRTPVGSPARRRARLFALAFGVRDGIFVLFMVSAMLSPAGMGARLFDAPLVIFSPLLFVPLLAYGILRGQLLGIELIVKRGLARALVVGAFVVVFFAASEGTERLVAARYGTLGGLFAAAALAVALVPLQRGADRLVDRVMPGVEPSPEYLQARRLELYRAAVESAHESGGVSEKERETLARLRAKLGIEERVAERVERDVLSAAAPRA